MTECQNCGTELASDQRFCPRCGAPGGRVDVAVLTPREPRADSGQWEVCEIRWWRGYFKSEFFALAAGPDGEYEAGRSPSFWWRHNETPAPRGDALTAHERLVAKLSSDHWEVISAGEAWYAHVFRRRIWRLRPLDAAGADVGAVERPGPSEGPFPARSTP